MSEFSPLSEFPAEQQRHETPAAIDPVVEEARSLSLTRWGMLGTAFYIGGLSVAGWQNFADIMALKPNEFADLLGGIFSPLAFLWLVLGFLQQGQELRASVNALQLQGEELRNSVEQQRQLVEVTKAELNFQAHRLAQEDEDLERSISPRFEIEAIGSSGSQNTFDRRYDFLLTNYGHQVTKLALSRGAEAVFVQRVVFNAGDHINFAIEMPMQGAHEIVLKISYINQRGRAGQALWTIGVNDGQSFAREILFGALH